MKKEYRGFKIGDRVATLVDVSNCPTTNKTGTIMDFEYIDEIGKTAIVVKFDEDVKGWSDKVLGIPDGHGLYIDFGELYPIDMGVEAKMMQKTIKQATQQNLLKVKQLRLEAKLPKYESDKASGFDVRAYDCVYWDVYKKQLLPVPLVDKNGIKGWSILPHITVIFKTGFAMSCGESEEIQVRARSGYSLKSPMRLSNGIGTVDEDFTGEIGVIMDNNGQYGNWFVPYEERIAQLVVCPIRRKEITLVEELVKTERGDGAYGSTGTK